MSCAQEFDVKTTSKWRQNVSKNREIDLHLDHGVLDRLRALRELQRRDGLIDVILQGPTSQTTNTKRSAALLEFRGPGFRLGARWNRLVETVKTRKKREFSGKKWARYGLKGVKDGS